MRIIAATESVFRIGSTSPAAILYDALHDFENRRPEADEKIRLAKPNLTEAVDTCIEAAGNEADVLRQKALLKAASFGKCFLEIYNSERFVDMGKSLRVLNAVREGSIGIPLTYPQYLRLTVESLVDRLVHRRLYILALKICDFLGLNGERVVSAWAITKIRTSKDNEDLLSRTILDRLTSVSSKYHGLSFADVAKEARANGRDQLAVKLLDLETTPSNQVFPLLSMKEYDIALTKAVQSGDTDLVYSALLTVRRELPAPEFFRLLRNKPAASRLFEVYCREKDKRLLQDFYYQDDRRVDEARLVIGEYLSAKVCLAIFDPGIRKRLIYARSKDANEKIAKLRTVQKLYADDKDSGFEAKVRDLVPGNDRSAFNKGIDNFRSQKNKYVCFNCRLRLRRSFADRLSARRCRVSWANSLRSKRMLGRSRLRMSSAYPTNGNVDWMSTVSSSRLTVCFQVHVDQAPFAD